MPIEDSRDIRIIVMHSAQFNERNENHVLSIAPHSAHKVIRCYYINDYAMFEYLSLRVTPQNNDTEACSNNKTRPISS